MLVSTEDDARSLGENADGASSSEGLDALLVDMSKSLVECRSPDDVFELIVAFMRQALPDAIVLVNEFTEDLEWLITRKVTGLDGALLEKAEKLAGIKVIGRRSAVATAFREDASGNTLSRVPGGFAELASGEIPGTVAAATARMLGIGDVFTVGISNSEHVFANVHILMRKPGADVPGAAIESFMRHCCSALSAIRQAQAHLESAEQLALILSSMAEGLALHQVLLDEDGRVYDYRFLDVNQAYEELTGLVGADIIGRTVLEILPETEPLLIERYGAVALTGIPDRTEAYSSELDKHFSVVAFSPQPGRFATLISDVTERRALESELEETRDMLVNLADQVPGVVYQYRLFPDGRSCFPYASAGMNAIYEFTPEELREDATPAFGRLHPDDLERVSAEIFESAEKLTPFHSEFRVVLPRQGLKWRVCDAAPQRLDDGSTLWYGIIMDSTDRVQAHLAQRESAARDAAVLKTAMDGFWLAGADGRILEVNDAYCAMSGYSQSELLGMRISDLDAVETPEQTARHIEQISEQRAVRFESRHRRKDGTTYPIENSVRLIPGSGGQMAVFLRDVSAARMATGIAHIRADLLEGDPERSIQELMTEALDRICEILESPIGFFHLVGEDDGALSLTAWSTATTESFCTATDHKGHYPLESAGIWADAIRERAPKIHNDYSSAPGRKGMPEGHAQVIRELVVPVFRDGKIRATLGVGNKVCDYRDVDLDAATTVADMLWQIVERKMVESELRKSEATFRTMVESLPVAIYLSTGVDQALEYMNPAMEKLFGYSMEDIPDAAAWWPRAYPDVEYRRQISEEWSLRVERAIAAHASIEPMEVVVTCKDGSLKNVAWGFMTMGDINYAFGLDLTERTRAEDALHESEATVRRKLRAIVEPEGDISTLELADIVDVELLKSLMEHFYRVTGMLGAVLDLSGKVVVAFGWQDICTKFHRCHPDTARNCLESDTALAQGVAPGTVRSYRCKNNLWDMVTPLTVGGQHLGNVFFGQFFFEGETPDVELFRAQARQYGFDETEYLAALAKVSHVSREAAEAGLLFCAQMAGIVASLSLGAIKQARLLAEQQRAEQKLRTSAELLSETERIGRVGGWSFNIDTMAQIWTDEVYRIHEVEISPGPSVDEGINYFTKESRPIIEQAVQRAMEHGEDYDLELEIITAKGNVRSVHSIGKADLQNRRIHGFFQDITERKLLEAELVSHRDHLDDLVNERTHDLADANRELEEATRAKDAFLANMSHELRTPLNSVIGFSGLLLQGLTGDLTEEQQRQIGMIHSSGRHLLALIEEVLDLSKIESGTVELFLEEFDAVELLAQLRDAVEPLASSNRLDLTVDIPPGDHMITSDRQKLYQIALNLVGNAVKFTDEGSVNIALAIDENAAFRISVTDTGRGIPEDQLGHIFEPFHQVKSDSRGKPQGTGLGLAISREFAQMLGATIEVTSILGQGSVFTLTVPGTLDTQSGIA